MFWRQNTAFDLDYFQADVLTLLPLVLTVMLIAQDPRSRVAHATGLLSGLFYVGLPIYYRTNLVELHHVATDFIYSVLVGGVLILLGVGVTVSRVVTHEAQ